MIDQSTTVQVKEVEAAAERAAAQSAAIIEEAMAQAEETRRRAEQDTQSQVQPFAQCRLLPQMRMRHNSADGPQLILSRPRV